MGAPEAEDGRAAGDEDTSPPPATGSVAVAKVAWCRAALALALAFFAVSGAGLPKQENWAKMDWIQLLTKRKPVPA